MKSYPQQIADILRDAPQVPALKRKPERALPGVSHETKRKLIALHAAYATFGHPIESTIQPF